MNIIIVGAGRVGLANANYLADLGYNIAVVDKNPILIRNLQVKENVYGEACLPNLHKHDNIRYFTDPVQVGGEVDFIIFCIDSGCNVEDLSIDKKFPLEQEIANYALNFKETRGIILRGTLTHQHVSHMRKFASIPLDRLVAFPEFLTEGKEELGVVSVLQNFISSFENNSDLEEEVAELYEVTQTTWDFTAEEAFAAKIWTNAALAMRVTLANMVFDSTKELCRPATVLGLIGKDLRIGSHYLKPSLGYGGSCLPYAMSQLEYLKPVFSSQSYNLYRPKDIADTLKSTLIFGFNFKGPDVEDFRDSPAIALIMKLKANGKIIYVTDNLYHPIVQDFWVGSPASYIDQVDDIVINYQTRWLTRFEENATPKDLEIFQSKIRYDFR